MCRRDDLIDKFIAVETLAGMPFDISRWPRDRVNVRPNSRRFRNSHCGPYPIEKILLKDLAKIDLQ